MKKHIICIIIIVLICFTVGLLLIKIDDSISRSEKNEKLNKKSYHDVELYTKKLYVDSNNFEFRVKPCFKMIEAFLPEYDELKYDFSNMDFYIFDGSCNMYYTAVSFCLDLTFDNIHSYSEAKDDVLKNYSFLKEDAVLNLKKQKRTPILNFDINNFSCNVVEGEFTKYPGYFGILCINDSDKIIRFWYFEEFESSEYVKDVEYMQVCTNCPWEINKEQ